MSVKHKEQSISAIRRKEAEKDILAVVAEKDGENKIVLTLDGHVVTGQVVKFNSPCACIGIDTLNINGVDYTFVDSVGNTVASISGTDGGVFAPGALVSALVNVETRKAHIQNAAKTTGGSKSVEAVLTVAGWQGETAPYTQTLEVEGVKDVNTNGVIGVSDSASDAQYQHACECMLRKCGQGQGSITVKAYSQKPTMDIPVTITITL